MKKYIINKIAYKTKTEQEFRAIHSLLQKFHYEKRHPHIVYDYDPSVHIVLETTSKQYTWHYGGMVVNDCTIVDNITALYNELRPVRRIFGGNNYIGIDPATIPASGTFSSTTVTYSEEGKKNYAKSNEFLNKFFSQNRRGAIEC